MTKRMLINARNPAELRVALTDDKVLEEYKVDVAERGLTRGNIYFGLISNIQPSLNAAFIDYGAERNGFLTIQDVVREAWYRQPKDKGSRPRIEEVLEQGQPIVVQVTREPEGNKGAALTTNLSLAGRYLVFTPFDSTRGVSRKVENDDDRRKLRELTADLQVPEGAGFIVRTAALGQNKTTLSRDLNALLRLWKRISDEARSSKKGKRLLYSDQDIVLQALRDYLDSSVEEVLVDEDAAYRKAQDYMRAFMPRSRTKLTYYTERVPLFSRYDLEPQIERIYQRSAPLPSGGSIVIDHTEALTAIDVNSGKATRAASQEETAVNTNVEAAVEVARQLRLRDIGGLVVVDFIDMRARRNQKKVEKTLADALKADKSRISIGRTSPNGLIEINRQRLQQAVQMRTHRVCPMCTGTGRVPSPEILGLHLLREIQARVGDGSIERIRMTLHPDLASTFQNQRRRELAAIENEYDVRIEIFSSPKLGPAEREIDWYARAELRQGPIVKKAAQIGDEVEDDVQSRKKRSRRRKKKGTGEATGEKAVAEKAESKPAEERRKSEAAAEKAEETAEVGAEGDEAPRKKSRRRRRRSRGGRGSGEGREGREGESEQAAGEGGEGRKEERDSSRRRTATENERRDGEEPSATAADKGGDGEKGGDGDDRPRRRRSRRRRRSGSADDGGDSERAAGDDSERPARAVSERPARDESGEESGASDNGAGRRESKSSAKSAPEAEAAQPPSPPADTDPGENVPSTS